MSPEPSTLAVERAPLQESLRRLRKTGKQSSEPVCLGYANGALTISWAGSSEQVPAKGQWPPTVFVPSGWLRALAKALPEGDPLRMRLDNGRVITESLSCVVVDPGTQTELVNAQDRARRISKAAAALRAFRVGEDDIEHLIDRSELEGNHRYHPDEDRLLKSVGEAWAALAVSGVSADDIYKLVQQQIRQAWSTGGRGV